MEIHTLATTITGLKKEVDELKKSLVGVNAESEKYKSINDQIAAKDKEILQLKEQLKQKLQENFSATKKNADANNEFTKSVEDTNNAFKDMRKVLMENKGELLELQKAYEAGQIGLDEFIEKIKGSGGLKDEMDDLNNYIRKFSSDTLALDQTLEGLQFGVATFGAVSGAMSALGLNTASTEKILKTFAVTQQLLNSLQVIQTQLMDKTTLAHKAYHSVLKLLGIEKKANAAATTAEATATTADAAAKTADAAATGTATIATKAFGVALKGIGIGLIIAAIAGLVEGLTWLNDKFNIVGKTVDAIKGGFQAFTDALGFTSEAERKQAAEAEKQKEANAKLKESLDEVKKAAHDQIQANSGLISKLQEYNKKIKDTNLSEKERVAYMKKSNEEAGVQIYNLKDTKKALANADATLIAYTKSLVKQSKAQAIANKIASNYLEILELEGNMQVKTKKLEDGRIVTMLVGSKADVARRGELMRTNAELEKQITNLGDLTGGFKAYSSGSSKATASTQQHTSSVSKNTNELSANGKAIVERIKQLEELDKANQNEIKRNTERAKAAGDAAKEEELLIKSISDRSQALLDQQSVLETALKNTKLTDNDRNALEDLLKKVNEAIKDSDVQFDVFNNKAAKKSQEDSAKKYAEEWLKEFKKQLGIEEEATKIPLDFQFDTSKNKDVDKTVKDFNKQLTDNSAKIKLAETIIADPNIDPNSEAYKKANEILAQLYKERETIVANGEKAIADKQKDADKKINDRVNGWTNLGAAFGNLMGTINDMMADNLQREIDSGKISEKEAKKRFERQKKFQISAAIVSGLAGAFGDFWKTKDDMTLQPSWVRWAVAGVDLASNLALMATQIQQIKSTEFGSDGTGGGTIVQAATPILDENRDVNNLSSITGAVNSVANETKTDTKVYVTEQDISDTQNKVKVREQNNKW